MEFFTKQCYSIFIMPYETVMKIPSSTFKAKKAAQVGAYFAKANGGRINVLKLVKLVYLADRHAMELYDAPILNDAFVSMNKGPVNSYTYDRLKLNAVVEPEWREFLQERSGHSVSLANPTLAVEDLDELSRADLRVLAEIWAKFGKMDRFELAEFTHEYCKEWVNPNGSSTDIPLERIFHYLGRKNSTELAATLREQDEIDRTFLSA